MTEETKNEEAVKKEQPKVDAEPKQEPQNEESKPPSESVSSDENENKEETKDELSEKELFMEMLGKYLGTNTSSLNEKRECELSEFTEKMKKYLSEHKNASIKEAVMASLKKEETLSDKYSELKNEIAMLKKQLEPVRNTETVQELEEKYKSKGLTGAQLMAKEICESAMRYV